jgi:transcriptional regulator NrdR family protein
MANFVTKKDGAKTPFDQEKIKHSVMASAIEAGLAEDESQNIANEVSGLVVSSLESMEEVTSEEIRNQILSELEVSHPEVAESWRKYEEGKGE